MLTRIQTTNRGKRQSHAGKLIIPVSILFMMLALFITPSSQLRKFQLNNHSQDCGCKEEKNELNFLHAIPMLLLPALELSEKDQFSVADPGKQLCAGCETEDPI